jgi:hypothetical protein
MSAVDLREIDLFGRDERWAFAYTGCISEFGAFPRRLSALAGV